MDLSIKDGFSEAWKLYSQYYDTDADDAAAWSNMVKAAGSIAERHKGFPVVEEFLHVLLNDIDRRSGERAIK